MKADDLCSGDEIVVNLPCRVDVVRVTPQDGSVHKGNRLVEYQNPRVVDSTGGHFDIGSLADVQVIK